MPDFYVEHAFEEALEHADERAFLGALDASAPRLSGRRYECLIDVERRRVLYRVAAVDANDVQATTGCPTPAATRVWIAARRCGDAVSVPVARRDAALVDIVAEGCNSGALCATELVRLYSACEWCLEIFRVELVAAALDAGGNRVLALFRAPDAEAVRQAYRRERGPFERVSTLRPLTGAEHPDPVLKGRSSASPSSDGRP
jgi:hypothetical protein